MLRHFKLAFPFDPCTFPKFHMTTHYPFQILMNGNVREGDAGSGERQHKMGVTPLVLPKLSFAPTAFVVDSDQTRLLADPTALLDVFG